jgi:hypothetical protein
MLRSIAFDRRFLRRKKDSKTHENSDRTIFGGWKAISFVVCQISSPAMAAEANREVDHQVLPVEYPNNGRIGRYRVTFRGNGGFGRCVYVFFFQRPRPPQPEALAAKCTKFNEYLLSAPSSAESTKASTRKPATLLPSRFFPCPGRRACPAARLRARATGKFRPTYNPRLP